MSFYLGKNGSTPLLHITKGANTESELKGSPRDNTVFHSSLPYLQVRSLRDAVTILPDTGRLTVEIPYATLSELVEGYAVLLLLRRGSWSTFRAYDENYGIDDRFEHNMTPMLAIIATWQFTEISNPPARPQTSPELGISPTLSTRYLTIRNTNYNLGNGAPILHSDWEQSTTDPFIECKFAVLNIKNSGYVQASTSGVIEVSSNRFAIGSLDIKNFKFIHNVVLNSTDITFLSDGQVYQIINSVPVSGGMSLEASNGRTTIKYGNKTIVDTSAADRRVVYKKTYRLDVPAGAASVPSHTSKVVSFTVASAGEFKDGDEYTVSISTTGVVSSTFANPLLMRYKTSGSVKPLFWVRVSERVANGTVYVSSEYWVELVTSSDGSLVFRFQVYAYLTAVSTNAIAVTVHKYT